MAGENFRIDVLEIASDLKNTSAHSEVVAQFDSLPSSE